MANNPNYPSGQDQANITNTTTTMPTSSTQVTLVAPSQHINIRNNGTTQLLYVALDNTTATTADGCIIGGGSFQYDGPSIEGFKVIASAATSTFTVFAW